MSNELFRESNVLIEILNIVDAVVLIMDKKGKIVFFNKAAQSMTGFDFIDVKNKTPWELFIPTEEIENVKKVFSQLTTGHFPNKHTNSWITKNKNKCQIDWSNTAIIDKNGGILFIIATGINVTEKKAAEKEIENHIKTLEEKVSERTVELMKANKELEGLTKIDGLTNIFNRRHFDTVIKLEIERAKRLNKPLSLLICDVDYFKSYNDTYGHVEGDRCLIQVATIIKTFFSRSTDFVARYGGEEFVVILPGIETQIALDLSNKLLTEIQNYNLPHNASAASNVVTISIGLVTKNADELTNSSSLIEKADLALYLAKEKGRNQVRLYSD